MRMLRWMTVLAAVASTSAGCGGRQMAGDKFLALGDSYTIGEGVGPGERWPVQLAELLRSRGVELGEPTVIARTGWTTDDLAAAVREAGPKGPFELVTLLIGVNDQYQGREADTYRPRFAGLLRRAVELAGGRPERVIVVSIPDWGVTPFAAGRDQAAIAREIDEYNAAGREEARKAGARYVEVTPRSRDAAADLSLLAADGLHPSARLYREWAEAALPEALAALGRGSP
jgi:lysophospholipase L1-like esterase